MTPPIQVVFVLFVSRKDATSRGGFQTRPYGEMEP